MCSVCAHGFLRGRTAFTVIIQLVKRQPLRGWQKRRRVERSLGRELELKEKERAVKESGAGEEEATAGTVSVSVGLYQVV